MQFLQIVLALVIVGAVAQVWIWVRNTKYPVAVFGLAYILIYMLDILNISFSGTTYIAASVGSRSASEASISTAIVLVIVTWILFSIGAELFSRRLDSPEVIATAVRGRKFSLVGFIVLSAIFGGAVLSKILTVGIAQTLELRQAVFSDNFLILLGYFVLPVLVSLGLARAVQIRGPKAFALWLLLAGLLGVTALTGSRSGLFLGAIIPVLALYWKKIIATGRSVRRDLQRILLVCALIAVPVLGGGAYLANTRGLVEDSSLLNGTDVSQADVLVDLISSEASGITGGATYLASISSAIPRSMWPEKPVPGNVASSMILTPERYYYTGAETTAGLLGEAYMNVGLAAPIVAAILMTLFLILCSRFLESRDDIVWMVGVILLIRGLNLLRGDTTNVVVPAIAAILVWSVLNRKASRDPAGNIPDVSLSRR